MQMNIIVETDMRSLIAQSPHLSAKEKETFLHFFQYLRPDELDELRALL